MLKVHTNNVFIKMGFHCMFLSILCKMLFQVNQNSTLRLLGYGFQMMVVVCYIAQELITLRRKLISGTIIILSFLVLFQCGVALWTHSVYLPYAPIDILIWPMSIIVYCNYAYQRDIRMIINQKIVWYYFAMCSISVPLIAIHLSGAGNIGQVIFLTYFCITSLPLILVFIENGFLKKLCMTLAVIISAASTKRAGTIALVMGIFVLYLVDAHIQGSLRMKWKKYLRIFVLLCVGITIVLYLDSTSSLQILERFARLSTDGGSGRNVIWEITLDAFRTSSLSERLFGHGFQSVYYVLKPGGFFRFAHNSYIEYLYDYGIIGVGLLALFIVSLIISGGQMIMRKSRFAPIMSMLLVITVTLSIFSYFFEESNIIMPISVAYGVVLGLDKKERRVRHEI